MPSLRIGIEGRGGSRKEPTKNPGTGPQGEQAPPEGRRPLRHGNSEGAITRKDTTGGGNDLTREVLGLELQRSSGGSTLGTRSTRVFAAGVEDGEKSDATPHPKRGLPNECPKSGEIHPVNLERCGPNTCKSSERKLERVLKENLQRILPENLQEILPQNLQKILLQNLP